MLINLRNALMTGKRLPYDAEVEYLQSSGTQWIDTGVIPDTQDIRIDITYANGIGHLFGSRMSSGFLSNNQMWSAYASKTIKCRCDWIGSKTNISVDSGVKTIVFASDTTGSSITYNGSTTTGRVKTTNNLLMVIFGVNTNGTITVARQMTLYSFKVWKNGVLVRDYIPVRKGTVGYLYDRVSGKLFGNAGSGDFVLGPDVVPATWVDGEYWSTLGVATALSGASRCENFIPVQPSSSVTFYLGARPGGTTLYMVQYNANKERVNSTYNGNGVARTVTIPANCYYIRVSAETAAKNEAYVHDDTNARDLLRNGMVPIPAE